MKLFFSLLFLFFNILLIQSQEVKADSLDAFIDSIISDVNENDKLNTLYDFLKAGTNDSGNKDFKYLIEFLIKESVNQYDEKYKSLGYYLLSDYYKKNGNQEKALENCQYSIDIAKNNLGDSIQIIYYNHKANIYKFFDQLDSSEVYFQKAIKLGLKSSKYRPLGYSYNGMASLQLQNGNYSEAINTQLKSLKISKEHNLKNLEISSLIGLGYTFIVNENYEKSLKYLKDAQTTFDKNKSRNKEQLCDILRFTGLAHSRSGNVEKGNSANKKALECLEETGNTMLAADVSNTIGANYLRNKQYKKSIPYFLNLISKAQALKSKGIENYGIINLSSAYIETNQLLKGEIILNQILKDTLDKELLPKSLEKVVYQNLSDLHYRKNDFKTSLKYHKKFKALEDSLLLSKKLKEVSEIDAKYQTEQKEKELAEQKIATQEQEILTQKANTRNWLLAIGLLALGISVFFIYRRYKSEAKAKGIISRQKSEIEKLQKEFHHRLKNDARSIKRFIGLVQKKFPETEFQERLDELKNRINSMFKVHEALVNEDDITQVNASTFLRDLSNNVESKYREDSIKVICNVSDKETIMADKAIPFGVVLNEFVTNSYKYAFDDKGGEIKIHFESDDDYHHLTLEDNGKGLPKDFDMDSLRSLGLTVIPMFAELHDGNYTLDSNDGVKLKLTLPKKVA